MQSEIIIDPHYDRFSQILIGLCRLFRIERTTVHYMISVLNLYTTGLQTSAACALISSTSGNFYDSLFLTIYDKLFYCLCLSLLVLWNHYIRLCSMIHQGYSMFPFSKEALCFPSVKCCSIQHSSVFCFFSSYLEKISCSVDDKESWQLKSSCCSFWENLCLHILVCKLTFYFFRVCEVNYALYSSREVSIIMI